MNQYRYLSPEKVYINLNLAGVGARFAALFIDSIYQALLAIFVIVVVEGLAYSLFAGLRERVGWGALALAWWQVVGYLAAVVVAYGYTIFFETVWNGQTPGKRFVKIRVVQESGAPVTFQMVLIRNFLRPIDALPGSYAVGIIAVLASKKNQRLGDMAAGTVVVREARAAAPAALDLDEPAAPWPGLSDAHLRKLTEADFAVLKTYLLRRGGLSQDEAQAMDRQLAAYFRLVLGVQPDQAASPGEFLRQVAAAGSRATK